MLPAAKALKLMTKRAKTALDSGISLAAFAEGSRTRNGHVKPFKKGIFNLAQKFGVPIVPVSIVGSYEFFQTGNWMLYPGKITVYLHDTIDTSEVCGMDVDCLARSCAGNRRSARGRFDEEWTRGLASSTVARTFEWRSRQAATGPRAIPARCKTTRWITVIVDIVAITQSTGAIRLNNPPSIKSTSRSGRSMNPTLQSGISDSARARE